MQVLKRLICGIGSPTELKGLSGQTSITSSRSFRPGIPGKSIGMRFASNCYEKPENRAHRPFRPSPGTSDEQVIHYLQRNGIPYRKCSSQHPTGVTK